MASIIALILGKDGVARVARVRTKTGELLRPLQRLYPLDFSQEESELPIPKHQKQTVHAIEKRSIPETQIKTRCGRTVKKPLKYCAI